MGKNVKGGGKVVRVSDESAASIEAYAEEKGISFRQAADELIACGVRRFAALSKYSEAQKRAARGR